jgi:nitroreductase/NAD-dependent dihydropyrimidine dehydrogenase PreA subunit
MGLLIINENKCKKDGICARECPMVLINLKDGNGFPEMVQGGEDICNSCGHCVAVCPHGALNHAWVPIENSPTIEKELDINVDQAVQFLRSRRSIRFFKKQPVEKEKLQRLIEIARYAPTGGNRQVVEWIVLTDEGKIRAIAERTVEWMRKALAKAPESVPPYFPLIVGAWDMGYNSVTWSAPALVVASAPEAATTGMVDVTLALSYLDLAAPKLGLGTCWAGLVEGALQASLAVREAVGLPEGHPYHYPMMIGYPKPKYSRVPERKAPKITWK